MRNISVRRKDAETDIEHLVRTRLLIDGPRIIIRLPANDDSEIVVSSVKEAQVRLWNLYCEEKDLLPDERESVKTTVFDEVARRVMHVSFADAWGNGER